MKGLRAAGVLALTALTFTACSDDDATGVELADLEGDWSATSFAYTDASIPTFSLDAVELGGSVELTVDQNGAFTGTLNIPQLTPGDLPIGGTIALVDDNTMSIDFDATTESYGLFGDFDAEYQLSGDVLTWQNDDTTFDFPDSIEDAIPGVGARGPVDAILTARFVR